MADQFNPNESYLDGTPINPSEQDGQFNPALYYLDGTPIAPAIKKQQPQAQTPPAAKPQPKPAPAPAQKQTAAPITESLLQRLKNIVNPMPYFGMGDVQVAGQPVAPVAPPPVNPLPPDTESAAQQAAAQNTLQQAVAQRASTPEAIANAKKTDPYSASLAQGVLLELSPGLNQAIKQQYPNPTPGQKIGMAASEGLGSLVPLLASAGTAGAAAGGAAESAGAMPWLVTALKNLATFGTMGAVEHGGKALEGQETPAQAAAGTGSMAGFGAAIGPLEELLGPFASKIMPGDTGALANILRGAAKTGPAMAGAQAASGIPFVLTGNESWKDFLKSVLSSGAAGLGWGAVGGAEAQPGEQRGAGWTSRPPTDDEVKGFEKTLVQQYEDAQTDFNTTKKAYDDAVEKYGKDSPQAQKAYEAYHAVTLKIRDIHGQFDRGASSAGDGTNRNKGPVLALPAEAGQTVELSPADQISILNKEQAKLMGQFLRGDRSVQPRIADIEQEINRLQGQVGAPPVQETPAEPTASPEASSYRWDKKVWDTKYKTAYRDLAEKFPRQGIGFLQGEATRQAGPMPVPPPDMWDGMVQGEKNNILASHGLGIKDSFKFSQFTWDSLPQNIQNKLTAQPPEAASVSNVEPPATIPADATGGDLTKVTRGQGINTPEAIRVPQENAPVQVANAPVSSAEISARAKKAAVFGAQAFRDGKPNVPAKDPELMNLLQGLRVGESAPILKAWHQAFINEPMPEEPAVATTQQAPAPLSEQILPNGKMGLHLQQYPTGRWGWVGSVPESLSKPNPNFRGNNDRMLSKVYDTKEDALADATAQSLKPDSIYERPPTAQPSAQAPVLVAQGAAPTAVSDKSWMDLARESKTFREFFDALPYDKAEMIQSLKKTQGLTIQEFYEKYHGVGIAPETTPEGVPPIENAFTRPQSKSDEDLARESATYQDFVDALGDSRRVTEQGVKQLGYADLEAFYKKYNGVGVAPQPKTEAPTVQPTYKDGDRVTFTVNGRTLTGTVRGDQQPEDTKISVGVEHPAVGNRPPLTEVGSVQLNNPTLKKIELPKPSVEDNIKPETATKEGEQGGQRPVRREGVPGESGRADVDRQGKGPLEGVSPQDVQGAEAGGNAEPSGSDSGQPNVPGAAIDHETTGGPAGRPGERVPAEAATTDNEPAHGGGVNPTEVHPATERTRQAESLEHDLANQQPGHNYDMKNDPDIGKGSQKQKTKDNLAAIRLLNQLKQEDRLATPDEQATLAKYIGWGGIPQMFKRFLHEGEEWYQEQKTFKEMVTPEAYRAAEDSTMNAHYTSPMVVQAMWNAMQRLGFKGGRVLEPGCGIGYFFGYMPDDIAVNSKLTGVELDPLTSAICKQLFQKADIRNQDYSKTQLANDFYDVAIGNVPFANVSITNDKELGKYKYQLHNYYFAKTMQKVRPGGIVMFITGSGTMRGTTDAATLRRMLPRDADLLGAVELPSITHKENALTEVTTDLLVLRKRLPDEQPHGEEWQMIVPSDVMSGNGDPFPENEYYQDHPDMRLGDLVQDKLHQQRSGVEYKGNDLDGDLQKALNKLPANVYTDRPTAKEPQPRDMIPAPEGTLDGSLITKDDKLYKATSGNFEQVPAGADQIKRIQSLLRLRDSAKNMLRDQLDTSKTDADLDKERKQFSAIYDAHVKKYGDLNKPKMDYLINQDPDWPLLRSLENEVQTEGKRPAIPKYEKADIFTKRTLKPITYATSAANAQEALMISLNERGRIDWDHMAKLTGKTVENLQRDPSLKDMLYINPQGNQWDVADEYLSGNVKEKLVQAQMAALADPAFEKNVKALQAVQPVDLIPAEISAILGSPWIPTDHIEDFIKSLFKMPYAGIKVEHGVNSALWLLSYNKNFTLTSSVANNSTWGTPKVPALDLIELTLQQKIPKVQWEDEEGKKHTDVDATAAARAKQEAIKEAFDQWIWKDEDRANELAKIYNDGYNNTVVWKPNGSHLTFPGLNVEIVPYPHQKNGVWRIVRGKNTLLGHEMGAGKTWTMQIANMEMRRMGLVNKPMHVVMNHMLNQYATDFRKAYPTAKVLVITNKDLPASGTKKGKNESDADFEGRRNRHQIARKTLFNRIATNDWDAVICTYSTFYKIPVSTEYQRQYINEQINEIEDAILELKAAGGQSRSDTRLIKQLAAMRKRLEKKLETMLATSDQDIVTPFEQLGVDQLFVDEADNFKNLYFTTKMTRVAGLATSASERAFDMHMKTRYLTDLNNGRGVVFATGTPISNTMAEMYTMMRYMIPDQLREKGLAAFDAWSAMFGRTVTGVESAPDGSGFRMNTRYAKFANAPEMLKMFRSFADIQRQEELHLPVPELETGAPIVITSDPSPALQEYLKVLHNRSEAISRGIDPKIDNMLKVTGDGRKAALDMRLVDPSAPEDPQGKINKLADNVYKIWKDPANTKTRATQLVFANLGTPKAPSSKEVIVDDDSDAAPSDDSPEDQNNLVVYSKIREKLIRKGIPPEEVKYIHDAKTDKQKQDLYAAVNNGDVRVLLGSIAKMGAGTNVQRRAVAGHFIDPPWRPRDNDQAEKRYIRPGNINKDLGRTVATYRYVTKGSFDVYMWQCIESKAKSIAQAMSGDLSTREMEDCDPVVLSAGVAKALATGNPRVLDKVKIDNDVNVLESERREFNRNLSSMKQEAKRLPQQIQDRKDGISNCKADMASRQDTKGELFKMSVINPKTKKPVEYTKRADADEALQKYLDFFKGQALEYGKLYAAGNIGGFQVAMSKHEFELYGKSGHYYGRTANVQSMEAYVRSGPEDDIRYQERHIEEDSERLSELREELKKGWPKQEQLDKLLTDQRAIDRELGLDALSQSRQNIEADDTEEGSAEYQPPEAEAEYQDDTPENAAAQRLYNVALYDAAKRLMAPVRYEALVKRQKKVRGVTTSDKIAVKDIGDATVMAHEVAHAVDMRMNDDKFLPNIMQRFPGFKHGEKNNMAAEAKARKELQAASQFNRGTTIFSEHQNKASELMANFIDLYIRNPIMARETAPMVTTAFEDKLQKFPEIQRVIDDLRDARAEGPDLIDREVAAGLGPAQDMETLRPRDFDSGDMLKSAQNTIVFADRVYRAKVEPIHVLADNLRKLVPNEEMQENIGAAMEHIGNLRNGRSADDVRKLIEKDPKAQKAAKEVQYQFEKVRQDINKYLKDMSDDEVIAFLENYLPHYYISPKKNINAFIGKWARTSPNMKKRVLPTLQEAVDAGLVPLTQNALKLLTRYAETNWRMAVNKRLIYDLKDIKDPETGSSVIQKQKVVGYKYLDHPAFRQLYAQRLPDGTLKLWEHGAYVQPDVYDALQAILENPIEGSLGKWMKAIQTVNAIGKEFIVTMSGFHHLFLMAAAHGELARPWNPFRGVFLIGGQAETLSKWGVARPHIAGKKLLNNPEFVEDASMSGLTMGVDRQASQMEKMLENFEARTRRIPALGKVARSIRQFKEAWNRNLWDNLMNPLKAISYYHVVRQALKKLPDNQFTPDNVRRIKEAVASHLNDAFLGQEWIRKFWLTPNGRKVMDMAIFAPDYLTSNISLVTKAVGVHPEARGNDIGAKTVRGLSRKFYLNMILGFLALVEAASYALNGKSSFENEVGHKLQINITPITQAIYGNADKTQHYINLSKIFRLDFLNLLSDPINYAGSHIAMVPKIALEQIFNAEPGSGYQMPWEQKNESFWNSLPERIGSAISQFDPIGFSANSFAFSMPLTKGMTHGKAYNSYEALIRGLVDPSVFQKFGRLINGDEYTSMKQQVDDACTVNGFDGDPIFKTAKSALLGEYYGDMWTAIKDNDDAKATEYATILLGMGASDTSLESSGTDRQVSDDQIAHAQALLDDLPPDVAQRQEDISDELSGDAQ